MNNQECIAEVRESRVKKSLLNAKVNLAFYFVMLVLSFFHVGFFLRILVLTLSVSLQHCKIFSDF